MRSMCSLVLGVRADERCVLGDAAVANPSVRRVVGERYANLRWDVVAAGCSPGATPSPLPERRERSRCTRSGRRIPATWSIVSDADRAETLYAKFRPSGADWALCTWDTVDQ